MNWFLFGYMGSGKSTIGKILSEKSGKKFVDMDEMIVQMEGMPITDIFKRKGEPYFRKLETKVLNELNVEENLIVSTGGGTPCFEGNLEFMNSNGVTIFFNTLLTDIIDRLKRGKAQRPLIAEKTEEELIEYVNHHLEARMDYYRSAHIIIDYPSRDEPRVSEILEIIENYIK